MKKHVSFVLSLMMIMMLFAGCGYAGKPAGDDTQAPGFPLTVTDFMGSKTTVDKKPGRVVSMAPSTTEILYEFGLQDKIVGVSEYDDYPPEVKDKEQLGGFSTPNIEAIVAAQPDIVLVGSSFGKENAKKLKDSDIPVVVTQPDAFNDIYRSYEMIGKITGSTEKANAIIKKIKDGVAVVEKRVKGKNRPKVYFVVSLGQSNFTAGKNTFIDKVINIAGGTNVASDVDGWQDYSLEKMVEHQPDIIIASKHAGEVDKISGLAGYKDTKAAKNGKIFIVDDNTIVRPTSRILDGINQMAKIIHPELDK